MAAKKLFTQIFIYFSKPLRLLYSLIIYEIVNFSFFTLYSLLLLSFFLYLKSVPIYVIVHVHVYIHCIYIIIRRGPVQNCIREYTPPPHTHTHTPNTHIYSHTYIHVYIYTHIHTHTVQRVQ